jgi:hypothetical protein
VLLVLHPVQYTNAGATDAQLPIQFRLNSILVKKELTEKRYLKKVALFFRFYFTTFLNSEVNDFIIFVQNKK